MAIAAAAGSPAPAPRRRRPPTWLLAPLALALAAVISGLVVVRDSQAHDHHTASRRATPARSPVPAAHTATNPARAGARGVDPFGAALRHWLAHRSGDITAAVQDLRGGRTWLYRAGHPEPTASIVKVDILATLLHERQGEGGLSEEDRELAAGMIESSDDTDASELWDAVGGASAVQSFDDSVGMHQTTTNAAWGLTATTPADQLKLLHAVLFPGGLLTTASRDYEYRLMRSIIPYDTWGVTAGPDAAHARVAFKNGWLPNPVLWQVNSIGSVYGDGRHYLIAVMSAGNPSWDYGIDTIEHISRIAWQDLDGTASR